MPYEVQKSDECPASEPWAVVNPDTGKVYGCHETEEDAREQQEALYVHAPPEEEERGMEDKNLIRQLWDGIGRLFRPLLEQERAWSGAASNYADTDAYCKACLIDVNAAAGNDEKKQSRCKLPVKPPGSDSYDKEGCHAAAVRFNQLEKPSDVPEDAWDSAVKSAANKLISAYNGFDETAPEAVYEAAGKERPEEERAMNLNRLYGQVDTLLMNMDDWPWLHDLYREDDGSLFVIVSSKGKLYRVPIILGEDDSVALGEFVQVAEEFTPIEAAARTSVIRQKDGRARWLSVSATAVLNRVGEIDSTALFDSFVNHAQGTGEYPFRCFYHQGEAMRTGQADFLAREGAVFITSGLYDEDNALAEAEVAALERDTGKWGESIRYRPTAEPELIEVAEDVSIPVYREGAMIETSLLPQDQAAGWFTTVTVQEVSRMRQEVMDALLELCDGDEEQAKGFAALVDGTNRAVEEGGLIARAAETGEAEPDTDTPPEETPPEGEPAGELEVGREIELDDAAMDAIAAKFAGLLAPLTEKIEGLGTALGEMRKGGEAETKEARAARAKMIGRLDALERDDEERQREWLADLPRADKLRVTYRPREANAPGGDGGEPTLAEIAAASMAAING